MPKLLVHNQGGDSTEPIARGMKGLIALSRVFVRK